MKLIKILTDPYTVIISFFMILINGEAFGGFFLLYLLFGLPVGAIHSLLSLFAIVILLLTRQKYQRKKNFMTECLLEIFGVVLLLLSLFLFFYNDEQHYNYGTFYHVVPVIMLILFLIVALASIVSNVVAIYKISTKRSFHNINL